MNTLDKNTLVQSTESRPGFIIDIDGVVVKNKDAIARSSEAIAKLKNTNTPYVFLTNGIGSPDRKAEMLTKALNLKVNPDEVVMCQSPISKLFKPGQELHEKRVLLMGNNIEGDKTLPTPEEATHDSCKKFAKLIGCEKFYTIHEMQGFFPHNDCVNRLRWEEQEILAENEKREFENIDAIVIMCEPVAWESCLQFALDVILGEGNPGVKTSSYPKVGYKQIPIYPVSCDLTWSGKAATGRFGNGAFLNCLEGLYEKFTGGDTLDYQQIFGKPSPASYDFATQRMRELYPDTPIKNIYGVGDNPKSDIAGCNVMKLQTDELNKNLNWISVCVETGIYQKETETRRKRGFTINHAARDFTTLSCDADVYCYDLFEAIEGGIDGSFLGQRTKKLSTISDHFEELALTE